MVSWVTSGLVSLLQRIPLWSRKRRGPVTGLSVPEDSACTLCLFTSPSSSAVVAWARPGAPTVRNVPFQAQVRHAPRRTHVHSWPHKYTGQLPQLELFFYLSLILNLVFNNTVCFCHFCRNHVHRRVNCKNNYMQRDFQFCVTLGFLLSVKKSHYS